MFSFCVYFTSITCCLVVITFCRKYYLSNIIVAKRVTFNNQMVILMSLLLASLPLTIVGGFRAESVGTDTGLIYYPYYFIPYAVRNIPFPETEFGFTVLIKLAKMFFGTDYTGMLLVVSTFTTIFSMIGIIRAPRVCKGLYVALLYLCFLYFNSFNAIR